MQNTPLNIDFYSIIFVKGCIITAGKNGYVYIWDERKALKN